MKNRALNTFTAPRGLQNYGTPAEFKAALDAVYHFDDYDPCPLNPSEMRNLDGLGETPHHIKSYFCNPPYGNVGPWLDKAIRDKKHGITGIYLLRVDCSTNWMHDKVFPYARPIWVRGRLKFIRLDGQLKSSPFASMVAAYEPRVSFPPQSVMWQDKNNVWHILETEDALAKAKP